MKSLHRLNLGVAAAALACAADAGAPDATKFRRKEAEDVHAQLRGLKKEMAEQQKSIQDFLDQAAERTLTAEEKSALSKLASDGTGVVEKMAALEQKLAELTNLSTAAQKSAQLSIREQLQDDAGFKSFLENRGKFRKEFEVKAVTLDGTGGAGDLAQPFRRPGIITPPGRQLTIRDILTVIPTTQGSIEYVKETGFANAAAAVAEGATKPESNLSFSLETAPVRTIAHWIQASKQILDDVPSLLAYIEARMTYGLDVVEEDQLLSGDGTGANLTGFLAQATPYDTSRTQAGDTRIDIIRRAMTQVRLAEYRADAILIHPDDWEQIELTKTDDGAYVWANPAGLLGPRLWGLPVIESTALEPGEFVVGAFGLAATLWDRETTVIDLSTDDRDNFIKNMLTIRAEKRIGLTVERPEAIIYGEFEPVT